MKNKFMNISIGASIMLLSAGFFVRSINTANAAPRPEAFIDESTNKIGKYMMQIYISPAGIRSAMVWDTESGKSRAYYLDGNDWKYERCLPENPLGE